MAEVIARVGKINGEAFARDASGKLRRLKSGDSIREGEVVQAAEGGQVQLKLADGRELVVDANEAAKIDAEVAAPDLPNAGDSAIQNNPKGFAKVSKAIVGSDGTFSFEDDGGRGAGAIEHKDGHTFIELMRVVEAVDPLAFQFSTTRFPLTDTIQGSIPIARVSLGIDLASQLDLANDNPVLVADSNAAANSVAENAATGTVVGVTALGSDADSGATITGYTLTNDAGGRFAIDPVTGVVTVANGSLLDYESATSHTITVQATSSDGSVGTANFTINLSNVNDNPVLVADSNAAANSVAENAATGTVVGVTALGSDADSGATITGYTLTNDAGGRFAIDPVTGVVTVANGSLLDYESATSHTITVQATSSDGSVGTANFTINLSNANEAPVNAMPASYTTNEDTSLKLSGLSVADVDAGSGTMTVTLAVGSGTLTAASAGGVTVAGSGTGSIVLSGTLANLNTYLATVANQPTYVPVANASGTVELTMTTSDGGNTGTGGPLSDTDSINLNITAVNDAPLLASGSTLSYTENQVAQAINGSLTVSDADNATLASATVSITGNFQASQDVLGFTAGTSYGNITGSYNAATGVLTLSSAGNTATVAQWQAALRAVTYANTSDNPSTLARTISYQIDDGQAANHASNTVTSTVNVAAVNDAPVNAMPASYTTNEDTSLKLSGLSVADVDAGSGTLTVTLSVGSGTLTAASAGGVTVTGSGTGSIVLSGTRANLNTYLATAANQPTYVPVANANGTVALTMTTSDGGNTGTGGPLNDTDSININITAVADTPSLSFGALVYTATSITSANATTTTNGFNMLAYNPNGSAGAISLKTGSPDGFGVSGAASGDTTELGYLAGTGSESLVVNFDNLVSSIDVAFAWLAAGERYSVQFLNAGTVLGSYTSTIGGTDAVDAVTTLRPASGAQFNQVIFTAPSGGDNDYLINKIVFDRVTSSSASSVSTNDDGVVNLGLTSSLADADGSETLKVEISGIPSGFTLTDGTNTFTATGAAGATSNVDVTGWSISSIKLIVPANVQGTAHLTATATATEISNLDSASLSRTVDVVITHPQTSAVDTVITNTALGTAFTIPMSAFLYNDVGAASITAISSANSLTASLSGSNVVITDTGGSSASGGSFNYTASTSVFDLDTNSTVVKTSTGSVTVTRDSGDMDGTTADNILVDTSTNATTINGLAGNDVLVSTAASGGDTLNGGAGNDMLTGGAGADTFVWNLADRGTLANPARDVITDFNTATYASGGDRLDLRDILQGTATTATALDSYLDFSKQGSDTVINVRPNGAGGEMTQQIVLQGVDLTSNGTLSDQAIIQDLLTKGKLQTD
ncbi:retention module-containing protein [Dechloromonas sp. H13]|uniref:retention module-containing protein n=1 Tax=Dechloromonas sp. H13 TaxID=2570193 RepID=UPI001290A458|nr:retention module-containing protein [Dechloromonas sp. H13]